MVRFSWLPLFLIIFLGSIWGSSFILMKRGLEVFTPIQVAGLRLFLAGCFLTPWVYRYSFGSKSKIASTSSTETEKLLKPKDYFFLFLTGFIGNAIPAYLFSMAGVLIPSGLSGILNAFTPVFTLVVGVLIFKSPITRNGILGVVSGILGAVFLLGPSFLGNKEMSINLAGAAMGLTASLLYGYNINLIKTRLAHIPPMAKTAFPFFFMGLLYAMVLYKTQILNCWPNAQPFTVPQHSDPLIAAKKLLQFQQAWKALGFMAILGFIGSAISMMLFNYLIEHTTALVASTNTFVIPVVAVAWGLFDHEPIRWNMFVGLMLSLVGVYLVMRKEK